jgi:hypothetical protein
MIFIVTFMVIIASLLAITSGIWVFMGLVTELLHPSESSREPSANVSAGDPEK